MRTRRSTAKIWSKGFQDRNVDNGYDYLRMTDLRICVWLKAYVLVNGAPQYAMRCGAQNVQQRDRSQLVQNMQD